MEHKLLIIEDDFQCLMDLKHVLPEKVKVLHAFTLRDAGRLVAQHQFSITVLKLCTGESDAYFDFLADLRAARPMPILLSNTSTTEERTRAYNAGADLCIDAPVHTAELNAGIRAMLRRYLVLNGAAHLQETNMTIRHKELTVEPLQRIVTMRGIQVELLAKEFDILHFLAHHPGIVFTRDQIYEHVWREEHAYGSRSVADHISAIHKKLGLSPKDREYIETIRHVGYRLVP